jgi:hypothetical protein
MNRLLSFDTTPPTTLRCRGNVFIEPLLSNDRGIHRPTDSPLNPSPRWRGPISQTRTCLGEKILVKSLDETWSQEWLCWRGPAAIWPTDRPTHLLWYGMDSIENDASNNSIIACIRCHGSVSTEPLPSNDKWIHIHTDRWEGFMKYAVKMGSGAMIYTYQVS